MKHIIKLILFVFSAQVVSANCHDLLNFEGPKLRSSETINFCEAFNGKTLLVVNTASKCGFTPQFAGLEKLHKRFGDQLAIVGFPSNDFNQEYADDEKISNVCYVNYGVTFTMLETSHVTGDNANQLFRQLEQRTGKQPSWNFNKYLISADGSKVEHFPSNTAPDSDVLLDTIQKNIQTYQ